MDVLAREFHLRLMIVSPIFQISTRVIFTLQMSMGPEQQILYIQAMIRSRSGSTKVETACQKSLNFLTRSPSWIIFPRSSLSICWGMVLPAWFGHLHFPLTVMLPYGISI